MVRIKANNLPSFQSEKNYFWLGNIREMESIEESAILLTQSNFLSGEESRGRNGFYFIHLQHKNTRGFRTKPYNFCSTRNGLDGSW